MYINISQEKKIPKHPSKVQGVSQLMSFYIIMHNYKNNGYIATIICQYIRL